MPRPLFPLGLLAVLSAFVAGAALAAGPTLDRIKRDGVVKFGYRAGAAPFSFADREGRVRGYSVELCTRIAATIQKTLGLDTLKVEWLPVDAANRLDAVASGRVDAECGTTTITLARMEKVDFSLPIFVDGGSALVRARAQLAALKDLKGKKVGVIPGTTTEQVLATALSSLEAPATLVPVKDGFEGLAQLEAGKIDAYASDRIVLAGLRQRSTTPAALALLEQDYSYEPYGIVVRRDDPDFRLAVNRGLTAIYRRGEIDAIFQRWLAPLGQPGPLLHSMFYLSTVPE